MPATLDEQANARLQAVEALAEVYGRNHVGGLAQGYYGTFLSKLGSIVLGAARDYGMNPVVFYLVGLIAPLGEELTTVHAATKIPSMATPEAARLFLRSALASVERSEEGGGLSL